MRVCVCVCVCGSIARSRQLKHLRGLPDHISNRDTLARPSSTAATCAVTLARLFRALLRLLSMTNR